MSAWTPGARKSTGIVCCMRRGSFVCASKCVKRCRCRSYYWVLRNGRPPAPSAGVPTPFPALPASGASPGASASVRASCLLSLHFDDSQTEKNVKRFPRQAQRCPKVGRTTSTHTAGQVVTGQGSSGAYACAQVRPSSLDAAIAEHQSTEPDSSAPVTFCCCCSLAGPRCQWPTAGRGPAVSSGPARGL